MISILFVPDLLPSRPAAMTISKDIPSTGGVRPFGLARVAVLRDGEAVVSMDGVVYDPARQLNVDAAGWPWVETPGVIHAGTTLDTQYDMQWFTDKRLSIPMVASPVVVIT